MKKQKKTFDFIKALNTIFKPKKEVKKIDKYTNREPYWMYKNE